jgi:hypothetical protein
MSRDQPELTYAEAVRLAGVYVDSQSAGHAQPFLARLLAEEYTAQELAEVLATVAVLDALARRHAPGEDGPR